MSTTTEEFAAAVYQRMMTQDYCTQWLGAELLHIDEGHCQLRMTVRREMLNGFGVLHGGIAFTLADSAFAFAANSYGRVSKSIHATMHYARSAAEGEVLMAEAQAINVTHRTADFDVTVRGETGEAYYFFRGTVYRSSQTILDPQPVTE